MPLTRPSGSSALPPELLGSAAVHEVLYEAEVPVVFTIRTDAGLYLLAYLAQESDVLWYVLAPCSEAQVSALKSGRLAVRDALLESWTWLATQTYDGEWRDLWTVAASALPDEHLPRAGVMIRPELQPVLTTRALGQSITRNQTPASVVAYVADATRKALKDVLEFVLDKERGGRPDDHFRASYDLPVQAMAFRSFEISFGQPSSLFDDGAVRKSVKLLAEGLKWASQDGTEPLLCTSNEERAALLGALARLTPPSTGAIQRIEIGGKWIPHGVVRLGRNSSKKVRAEIKRSRTSRIVTHEGWLGELDKDRLSFILRAADSKVETRGTFGEDLLDEMLDHFTNDTLVEIAGMEFSGKLHVFGVSPVHGEEDGGEDDESEEDSEEDEGDDGEGT